MTHRDIPNGEALERRLAVKDYIFDSQNDNFSSRDDHNRFFLQVAVNYLNDLLQTRGYVFLNEVLTRLGIAPRGVGQLVGWTRNGQGYIDIRVSQVINPDGGFSSAYALEIEHEGIIAFHALGD